MSDLGFDWLLFTVLLGAMLAGLIAGILLGLSITRWEKPRHRSCKCDIKP